jgi:MFS transporter, Spinster family, sphingosine-1-phosphate transporter
MNGGRDAWLLVGLLWVVALLNYVDRQVIFSVFPLLSADLHLSDIQLGFLSTVFLWVYGLLSPISGFVADRFGRARYIAMSLLVWSGVTLGTGLARTYPQLVSARGLMGISEACYLPAALAKIAERHGPRTRSLAVGVHQTGLYAGMVLGGAGGGWMGQRYGWRTAFLVLGAAGLLYFLVLRRFFRNERRKAEREHDVQLAFGESVRLLNGVPKFWTMTAVFSAVGAANWLVYTWLPSFIYERFHVSLGEAGFAATFYIQTASFAGILAGGWLADRGSTRVCAGRLYIQVAGVLLAAPFLFVLGYTRSYAFLVVAMLLFGIGRGFYECNTMPVLCQVAPDRVRSTAYGVFNMMGCLTGGVLAAAAGGLKQTLGLGQVFQAAAVILLFSALALFTVRKNLRHLSP